MSPLPRLRLPSRFELEILGLVVIAALCALYANERERVATRDALLAVRPTVEERVREVRVEGPVRTVEKIVKGEVIERVTTREVVRVEKSIEHIEAPACAPAKVSPKRYAGLALSPADWDRPRVSLGLTFNDRVDVGAFYDLRYSAAGAEARYRF